MDAGRSVFPQLSYSSTVVFDLKVAVEQKAVKERRLFFGHRRMDSEKEEQPLLALAHAWSLRSPPQACDSKAVTGCSPEAGL